MYKKRKNKRKESDYVTGLLTGKIINRNLSLIIIEDNNKSLTRDENLQEECLTCKSLNIDYSIFHKSKEEKSILKLAKKQHNKYLTIRGFNHKQRLNVSKPMIISVN